MAITLIWLLTSKSGFWISLITTIPILVLSPMPLVGVAITGFAGATYKKMVQNLAWATRYNVFAIPLAAGVLYTSGIFLSLAMGAVLMSLSTIIVAINAKFLRVLR